MSGRRGSFVSSRRLLSEAANGELESVKELVKANATVDKEDYRGTTALMIAVKNGKAHGRKTAPSYV